MADDHADAAPAAPQAPACPDLETRLWAAIRAWRDIHIAAGPIARATDCWNHLDAALTGLVQSILKEV